MTLRGNSYKQQVWDDYGVRVNGDELRIAANTDGLCRVSATQVLTYDEPGNQPFYASASKRLIRFAGHGDQVALGISDIIENRGVFLVGLFSRYGLLT